MKIKDRLLKRFRSIKYRHAYVDEFTDAYIATQIKVLREQRDLKQQALADLAGMRQSQISELEDVNNRSWKVRTLKKLAKAFDLVLVVRFEEFGKVLPDIGRLDREHLQRASFKDDPAFSRHGDDQTTIAKVSTGTIAATATASGRVLNAYARFGKGDIQNVA
jgi:transcriptional regulator with XRE-family HTH domain